MFDAGLASQVDARFSARSIRASVSSRPSSATLSKIPGETVVPAIATRTGWNTWPGLLARASTTDRSATSTASASNRSVCSERLARRLQRLDAAVTGDRLLERLRIVDGTVEHESDERPELGQGLDLLRRDLDRVVQAAPPRQLLQRFW